MIDDFEIGFNGKMKQHSAKYGQNGFIYHYKKISGHVTLLVKVKVMQRIKSTMP
jgi:hypothetical protein